MEETNNQSNEKKVRPILNRIKTIGDLRSKKGDAGGSNTSPVASPRVYNANASPMSAPSSPNMTGKGKLSRGRSFWQTKQKDEFDEALELEKEREKEKERQMKEREKEKKKEEKKQKKLQKKVPRVKTNEIRQKITNEDGEEIYIDYPLEAIDEAEPYEEYSESETSDGDVELVDEDGDTIDGSKKTKFKKNWIKWVSMFSYFPTIGVSDGSQSPRSPTINSIQTQKRRDSLCLD